MSAPAIPRPERFGRRARLTLGAAALCVVALVVASRVGTDAALLPAPAFAVWTPPPCPTAVPMWTLDGAPVSRVGYRLGRPHTFEVVALGPTGVEVEVGTARAFLAMRAAAAKSCIDLRLESGFRTGAKQRELFRAWRQGRGNKAARPGQSNHQSGRALDIAVNAVPGALAWLQANAAGFGFSRTVKNEPWHWEYADGAVARDATRVVRKAKWKKATKGLAHGKRPAKHHAGGASRARVTASAR